MPRPRWPDSIRSLSQNSSTMLQRIEYLCSTFLANFYAFVEHRPLEAIGLTVVVVCIFWARKLVF